MGQYYKIIILTNDDTKKEENIEDIPKVPISMWIYPYDYGNGGKLMEHSYIGNNFVQALENIISPEGMFYMHRVVWAGDYADDEKCKSKNLYSITEDLSNLQSHPPSHDTSCYKYVVNHTKNMYVDKNKAISNIHPLPLLISEGNGKGGGDYTGNNVELCGTWARDIISVEKEIPENYLELICDFCD